LYKQHGCFVNVSYSVWLIITTHGKLKSIYVGCWHLPGCIFQAKISSRQSTQQALVGNSAVLAQAVASQVTPIQAMSVEWDGAKRAR
jgi:hypothetical protein